MLKIEVVARLMPTEDPEKVLAAMKNIFPELEYNVGEGVIIGRGEGLSSLNTFFDIVGREGIGPRTLALFKERRRGDSVTIPIDREVATVGRLSFDDSHPIWLEIRGDIHEVEKTLVALTSK